MKHYHFCVEIDMMFTDLMNPGTLDLQENKIVKNIPKAMPTRQMKTAMKYFIFSLAVVSDTIVQNKHLFIQTRSYHLNHCLMKID